MQCRPEHSSTSIWRYCSTTQQTNADTLASQSLIPVVMAGIIAVYALVVAVLISSNISPPSGDSGSHYSLFNGFMHLAAGLSVGLSGLAAGYTIGIVGDTVRWHIFRRGRGDRGKVDEGEERRG